MKRRSSVQSTHRTALLCPSATWTHCNAADRLLLVAGTGLMMPLQHTHTHILPSIGDEWTEKTWVQHRSESRPHIHSHAQHAALVADERDAAKLKIERGDGSESERKMRRLEIDSTLLCCKKKEEQNKTKPLKISLHLQEVLFSNPWQIKTPRETKTDDH